MSLLRIIPILLNSPKQTAILQQLISHLQRPPANVATKPVDTSSVAAPTNSANTTPATKPPAVGNVIREGDEYDANGNLTKVGNKYSGNNIGENFTINGEAPRRGGYMVVPGGGFGGTRAPVSDTGFVPGSARSGGGRVTFVGDTATEERNARLSNGLSPYAGSPNGQLTANQVRVLAGLKRTQRTMLLRGQIQNWQMTGQTTALKCKSMAQTQVCYSSASGIRAVGYKQRICWTCEPRGCKARKAI